MPAILTGLIARFLPHWRPLLLALAALLCFYAGWHGRAVLTEAERAGELQAAAERRRKQDEENARLLTRHEAELAAIQRTNRELQGRLARETNKPEYDCRLPSDGLRLRDAAAAGKSAGEPDAGL